MTREKSWVKTLRHVFSHKPVYDLRELSNVLSRSGRTVLRYLKWLGYYTSYNFNSRYYTLEGIPQFDKDGLWQYEGIWFSCYKTLRKTVRRQIEQSEAGMTSGELGEKLHTRVANQMGALLRDGIVEVKKYGRPYLYYSSYESRRSVQMARREKALKKRQKIDRAQAKLLSTRQSALKVIEVLVTRIDHPDWGTEEIAKNLTRRGIEMSVEGVEATFEHFHLAKKNSTREI